MNDVDLNGVRAEIRALRWWLGGQQILLLMVLGKLIGVG